MAFKIINPAVRVSDRAWCDVDESAILKRLEIGLTGNVPGARAAIREVYGSLLSNDLTADPAAYWQLNHHEMNDDGDLLLNINGLDAAAKELPRLACTLERRIAAARHLKRHYDQTGRNAPDTVTGLLDAEERNLRNRARQIFTLDASGKPVELATGKAITPLKGSIMAMRFYNRSGINFLAPARADRASNAPAENSFATRKENWPEGRDEDAGFYWATFRALSAGLVNPLTYPIDFSKNEGRVLKKATSMMKNKPWLKNHSRSIDAQIGSVTDAIWDEGDAKRSAGINALTRTNLNAPQADTVAPLLEAGDAGSTSVTVWYEWEMSHDLDDWEFFNLWGTELEDELVRVIVTKVLDLTELSLVWDGADPDAKRIAAAADEASGFVCCAVGLPPGVDGPQYQELETSDGGRPDATDTKELLMTEKLKQALAKVFGVDVAAVTEEFANDIIVGSQGVTDAPAVADLLKKKQAKVDEYVGIVKTRDEQIVTLKASAERGEKYLADTRADAARFYKLAKGDKASDTILKMVEGASLVEALELREQFRADADAAFPLTCDKCGHEKCSRSQTADTSGEVTGEGGNTATDQNESGDGDVLVDLS
jgi:hypothetical protein